MSGYVCSITPDCLDGKGLARIPALYGIIINAIGLHIREEGLGIDTMEEKGLSWALARGAVEFGRRPSLYEKVTVDVKDGDHGRWSFAKYVRVTDAEGNLIAGSVTDWCVIGKDTHKPALLDAAPADEPGTRPCTPPLRLRPFASGAKSSRTVGYSECDFNGHLNNCRFVEMFYDLLPLPFATRPGNIRLDINFVREVPLGAKVVSYLKTENGYTYDYCIHNAGAPACCASVSILHPGVGELFIA